MPKITPFLWLNDNAEAALNFYLPLFKDSRIVSLQRRGKDGPLFHAIIELAGQRLHLLNGGSHFTLNEAFSLFVDCEDQAEVDRLWEVLSPGAGHQQCGWITDKFGVTWQIVPRRLMELLSDPDPQRAQRATDAMMTMKKIVIADLEAAANG